MNRNTNFLFKCCCNSDRKIRITCHMERDRNLDLQSQMDTTFIAVEMAQLCIKIRLYLWHSHFHALFRRARGCQPLYLICSRNFHICFQFFSKLFFQLGKGICTKCHFADLLCYVFCKSAFHCLRFQITFQCLHICTVQQILSIHRFGRINIHGSFDIFPCLRLISNDILSI